MNSFHTFDAWSSAYCLPYIQEAYTNDCFPIAAIPFTVPRWLVDVHYVAALFYVQRTRKQREETMLLSVLTLCFD